ncbi:Permease [Leptospira biflexa serovar Patoc strain 'Patoc 1 (Ames)']|uniref:Putative permease putative membrane protein n=1 Tax=Leptospira biflexa serovar Patoc (strain Patoc 1 / ATCC 23582 / Paris) TaxID=456481 RepID=B0SKD0_LEPBP|nr:AEC family transporter [Leptospira biflexa]ABZ92764.1 Permease [Leptospira biflexa serovar Patoc strain 'Patoc 1 (Ames)']ABZ96369.1 Putative permease; putative membrane protein [Leptospira biflexa serovar Patoc strain 'Patoc 1 (Paris)']
MENFLLLGICFGLGLLFRRFPQFPETTPKVLNGFILYVSLPSLVLYHVHELTVGVSAILPTSMPWLVFGFALLFFLGLYKLKVMSFQTTVCLVLTAGLGNTSFVGFPLLEAYLGKESLGYGILADQLGTFMVLSFPGIILASIAMDGKWHFYTLVKRVLGFAPIYALVFAILTRQWEYPSALKIVLLRLGDTLTPLALVSVGYMLDLRTIAGHGKYLLLGLGFKLVLAPILVYFVYAEVREDQLLFQTILLESAMAPMVTSTVITIEKNISPHLASLMLGIGIPVSFLTTYGLNLLIKGNII